VSVRPSGWRSPALGYAASTFSAFAMGSFFAVEKRLLDSTPIVALNWMHFSMVLVCCLAVWGVRSRRVTLQPLPYPWLLLFGLIACVIVYSRSFGLWATSATTGAVITRCELAFVLLLSHFVLHERIRSGGWIGIGLLLIGAFRAMDLSAEQLHWSFWGCAALLLAAVGTAVNALVIKLKFDAVPSELVALSSSLVQSVVWGSWAAAASYFEPWLRLFREPAYGALVTVGSALVMLMISSYYFSLKRIPMWSARMLALLVVLAAIFWDVVWLHHPPTAVQLQGAALAVVGALLVVLTGEVRPRSAPEPDSPA
jgi:drug/metabolite transporter (DMT)-like permease